MKRPTESGQIVIALLVLGALATLIAVMPGLLSNMGISISGTIAKENVKQVTTNVANRLQEQLRHPQPGCTRFDFTPFRNLALLAPPPVQYSTKTPTEISCVLTKDEADSLSSLEISVVRLAQPEGSMPGVSADLNLLRTDIKMRVSATARAKDRQVTRSFTVDRGYQLQVARLNLFALILASDPVSGSRLINPGQGRIQVQGFSYLAGTSASKESPYSVRDAIPFPTDTEPDPKVVFARAAFLRSGAIQVADDFGPVAQAGLAAVFPESIIPRFLHDIPRLPFEEGVNYWQAPIDFKWVYQGTGYPLPSISGGTAAVSATGDMIYDEVRATAGTLPSAGVLPSLDRTCAPSSNYGDQPQEFVFLRRNDNLVLDFGASGGLPVFCGLIAAKKLTIKAPDPARTYVIFGTVLADQIELQGKGTVQFISPASAMALPAGVALPSKQSLAGLRADFDSMSTTLGYLFQLPVAWDRTGIPADYSLRSFDVFMQSCGSYHCWKETVNPPDPRTLFPPQFAGPDKLGYLVVRTL